MTDARIITGNQAAAVAARLCDVQVIAAYPITPQSQLAEILSQFVESGQLRAEYVRVEGEHSAMTVCIGASTVGARVFTATSANGLLYMHEQLHWAAGSRLPIVMCCVNRGVGAPWSIFNDQQDSLAQRDTGWIQIYCRDNQEILDTVIQAYRIAETVYAPVMVCYDGFVLSHTMMPVVSPAPAAVRKFLPPYRPHTILDAANPLTLNSVLLPNRRPDAEGTLCDGYMEMRWKLQNALDRAPEVIGEVNRSFAEAFGRDHGGMLWTHRTEDAEVILSGMGSLAAEATVAADALREEGIRAGVVGIRVYRPFPAKEAVEAYRDAKAIVLFEKSVSYGYEGGLSSDLKAAFYGSGIRAPIHDHVAGLGGRDVKARELVEAVKSSLARIQAGERDLKTTWLNCATE
jgi:pyruvate/2-oxoacid:ferredoxin oxidoreductase alpha subunit